MEKNVENSNFDIFTAEDIHPSATLADQVLLFDNLDGTNPMDSLSMKKGQKLWQMTIFVVLEGEVYFNINGKDVTVAKNQILVTHEECIIEAKGGNEGHKYFMFVVYPETVLDTFSDIHLNYNKSKYSYSYCLGDLSKEEIEKFTDYYLESKADIKRPPYKMQINYTRCFLNVILVYIINKFYTNADMQADPSSRQYDMFCKFMDALNKHADKERSVQYYAKLLGITSKYLSFVCLQYSQKNASSWIDEYVVAKARALQNVHHYNIKRISQELNFISPSSFTRFFKRVTGAPPTK